MIERGQGGAIVNISSMTTNVAFPDHTSYCSSKGAVDTLTRVLALELGPHQVSSKKITVEIYVAYSFSPLLLQLFLLQTCSMNVFCDLLITRMLHLN